MHQLSNSQKITTTVAGDDDDGGGGVTVYAMCVLVRACVCVLVCICVGQMNTHKQKN